MATNTTTYVLVTGSRTWTDFAAIRKALSTIQDVTNVILVHGGAQGADAMAGHEWEKRGGMVIVRPPDWRRYGRAAELMRNECITAAFPISHAFAFWKHGSRERDHMFAILKRKRIPITCVECEIR